MSIRSWLKAAVGVAGFVLLASTAAVADSVSVTVVDKGSGAPLERAVVALVAGDNVVAAGRTNAQGVWSGTVPAGNARVTASRRLYASATSAAIGFTADGTRQVRLELSKHQAADFRRFGRVVGFVRNAAGQPLGNATLVLLRGNTPVGCAQPEAATGVYELEWYAPGTYSVLATAPGHRTVKYSGKNISAGESLWLDVILQPR